MAKGHHKKKAQGSTESAPCATDKADTETTYSSMSCKSKTKTATTNVRRHSLGKSAARQARNDKITTSSTAASNRFSALSVFDCSSSEDDKDSDDNSKASDSDNDSDDDFLSGRGKYISKTMWENADLPEATRVLDRVLTSEWTYITIDDYCESVVEMARNCFDIAVDPRTIFLTGSPFRNSHIMYASPGTHPGGYFVMHEEGYWCKLVAEDEEGLEDAFDGWDFSFYQAEIPPTADWAEWI
ncbi:hypothetical protein BJ508DRAFT_360687 [Ascobolus immersus RN42]|uniref:Uncharacterized protein n=1 Tax=Ascobolus immersus RN42 TaxID=1160509 RepID=A0A3N4IN21_ASCIM|nr:hypothetical protein BJ508DRAFT_360687 [Ascobolus immersus RN42]